MLRGRIYVLLTLEDLLIVDLNSKNVLWNTLTEDKNMKIENIS